MTADALNSPEIRRIREEVPEFESVFQSVLLDEDGELGSFQAMSTFAAWLVTRLQADPPAPEIMRSFAAIEQVARSATLPMGRALVTEFVEAIGDHADALHRLGPASRMYVVE